MKLNDQSIVSLVAGACLIGLIVVLKNVLAVSPEVLSRDIIAYIVIYTGFITSFSLVEKIKSRLDTATPCFGA